MSYLLFLDESGHDHKSMPYEVHGGIAIHDTRLWSFVRTVAEYEEQCFGVLLRHFGTEIKGRKLLDKDRWKWAKQEPELPGQERRRLARRFLEKGRQHPKAAPTRDEFTAYGQASLLLARNVFSALRDCEAKLFAAVIPKGAEKPATIEADAFLRKDLVFLLERYFYFLQQKEEVGLLLMDESECRQDHRLVGKLERYFLRTELGRERSTRIVPSPFFVSSEMAYPVQAADLCIYCVDWGFRLPALGMDAPTRPEIENGFRPQLDELHFRGTVTKGEEEFDTYGIVYVPNPYSAGKD